MVSRRVGSQFVSTPLNTWNIFNIQQYTAESEEGWFGFGILPPNEKTWYQIELEEDKIKDIDFGIFFQLSSDIKVFTRQTYTILDFLGDVGGLFGTLQYCGSLIVSLIFNVTIDPMTKFLVESQFKKDDYK